VGLFVVLLEGVSVSVKDIDEAGEGGGAAALESVSELMSHMLLVQTYFAFAALVVVGL
jgi:hypothetical protein